MNRYLYPKPFVDLEIYDETAASDALLENAVMSQVKTNLNVS